MEFDHLSLGRIQRSRNYRRTRVLHAAPSSAHRFGVVRALAMSLDGACTTLCMTRTIC